MNLSDRVEGVLSWYSREGRNKYWHIATRFLSPFSGLTLVLTAITLLYRPFAWALAVSSLIGFIGFCVAAILGTAGVMGMTLRGGPGDSLAWSIGALIVILCVALALWGLACFVSMIILFAGLQLDPPVGW